MTQRENLRVLHHEYSIANSGPSVDKLKWSQVVCVCVCARARVYATMCKYVCMHVDYMYVRK
jgi:hypothetical protein